MIQSLPPSELRLEEVIHLLICDVCDTGRCTWVIATCCLPYLRDWEHQSLIYLWSRRLVKGLTELWWISCADLGAAYSETTAGDAMVARQRGRFELWFFCDWSDAVSKLSKQLQAAFIMQKRSLPWY